MHAARQGTGTGRKCAASLRATRHDRQPSTWRTCRVLATDWYWGSSPTGWSSNNRTGLPRRWRLIRTDLAPNGGSSGGAGGSRPGPYRAPAVDAHDPPALALQDLGNSTVEKGAIGGRHLQAEGVEMRGDDAPADLHGRGTGKIGEQSAGAISHGPGGSHDADTPRARPAAQSLPTAPEPRLSAAVSGRSGARCVRPMCHKPNDPAVPGDTTQLLGILLSATPRFAHPANDAPERCIRIMAAPAARGSRAGSIPNGLIELPRGRTTDFGVQVV